MGGIYILSIAYCPFFYVFQLLNSEVFGTFLGFFFFLKELRIAPDKNLRSLGKYAPFFLVNWVSTFLIGYHSISLFCFIAYFKTFNWVSV